MDPVNVILCGAGRMGRHHLRIVREDPSFRLVAIVDPALAGGALDGVPVVDTPEGIDAAAAIVATPTVTHLPVVLDLIDRGLDLLVEKPLASTVEGCEAIADRARARGVRVAIGHVERFNPAVRALPPLGPIHNITFTRVGVARRCDVLLELAVHDLDLLEHFAGRASLRSARTFSSLGDEVVDAADLELVTESGASASIHVASSGERVRKVSIDGIAELDLLMPSVELYGKPHAVVHHEPLRAQLTAFRAFLAGLPSDVCGLDEATRSVALANAARASIRTRLAEALP